MAKKKNKQAKRKLRNAASTPSAPRNITPRAPRAEPETSLRRLGYTAAGAAGTALAGSFLAKEGWAPKTIATALAAVGAGLAWKGDEATVRSLGAGAMSAAGSQLALMIIDDRESKAAASSPATTTTAATDAKKPANANGLPPGALESALERARARLALSTSEPMDSDG